MQKERRNLILAILITALATTALTYAIMTYTWTETFTVYETNIVGSITVTGEYYEVNYPIEVNVSITNNRAENSSGYLTVTIENANGTVATLYPRTYITINATSTWSNSWTWTPDTADTYTAKAVYEET